MEWIFVLILLIVFGPWLIVINLAVKKRSLLHLWAKAYCLSLLRRELERLYAAGKVDEKLKTSLVLNIDVLVEELAENSGVKNRNITREKQIEAAWNYLCEKIGKDPSPFPPQKADFQQTSAKVSVPESVPQDSQNDTPSLTVTATVSDSAPVNVSIPESAPQASQNDTPSLTVTANISDSEPANVSVPESAPQASQNDTPSLTVTATVSDSATANVSVSENTEKAATESVLTVSQKNKPPLMSATPKVPDSVKAAISVSESALSKKEMLPPLPVSRKVSDSPKTGIQKPASRNRHPETGIQKPETRNQKPATSIQKPASRNQKPASAYAWEPQNPGALEQAIKAVSGWPRMITPFLVQNIGWFISIFLFITGCVFLVAYSTGFSRFLIIASILFVYPVMLMGGAYKLLRKRPELRSAGSVLITLGMLLIPLSTAASVRLTDMDGGLLTRGTGIFMVAINLVVFYWIAQLASGIMDRSLLKGAHTRLFMSLTAVQIASPFVAQFSGWHFPAVMHLLLLGLTGFGIVKFIKDWLKSLFLDRRKIAYYAAGTLIYAALVSFIHLTWRYSGDFPPGYAAPFLMILCGFLFYADSQFKEWTDRYAYLSRFSFVVYGLSVLSLIISFPSLIARIITLTLGIGVYASVFRHYLSLPPLYLLMICTGFLYHQLILRFLTWDAYFLASLPGLAGLLFAYRWLLKRNSRELSKVCFIALTLLSAALAGWSLANAEPGLTAAITGTFMTGLVYIILRYPGYLKPEPENSELETSPADLRNSPWFYALPLSAAITLAYFPLWIGLEWAEQFSLNLVFLSIALTRAGLRMYRRNSKIKALTVGAMLNSALISIAAGLCLYLVHISPDLPENMRFHIFLALSAGVLLWQSLSLKLRSVFYAALITAGAAGALIKYTYFPSPPTGKIENLIVWGIWLILWRMERIEKIKAFLTRTTKTTEDTRTTKYTKDTKNTKNTKNTRNATCDLTQFSIFNCQLSIPETVSVPLRQLMALLWGIGVIHFVRHLPAFETNPGWILNISITTLTTMLSASYFRLLWLWWIPLVLGLCGLLAPFYFSDTVNLPTIALIAVSYALLTWAMTRYISDRSITLRLAEISLLRGGHGGGRNQVERCTYYTAYLTTLSGVILTLWHWLNFPESKVLLPMLVGMSFFWLASHYYQSRAHSYTALIVLVISSLIIYVRLFGIAELNSLFADSGTGVLFAVLAFMAWSAAWFFDRAVFKNENFPVDFDQSLYRKPLTDTAMYLGLLAGARQIFLVGADSSGNFNGTALFVMAVSSLVFFLTNRKLSNPALGYLAVFSAVLTILWGYFFLFHAGKAFTLWPPREINDDIWIFVSLLSLGLACLSHGISRRTSGNSLYATPLWCAATLTYCWTLLKVLLLIVSLESPLRILEWQIFTFPQVYEMLLYLITGITLFPLMTPVPGAAHWRGIGILIMLSGFVVSLLSFVGLQWTSSLSIVWGFALWGFANGVLPRFNARFSQWQISPAIWPWAGFVLVFLNVGVSGYSEVSPFPREALSFIPWGYVLTGTIYCALMRRNTKLSVFTWLIAAGTGVVAFNLLDGIFAFIGIKTFNSQWLALSLIAFGFSALSQYLSVVKASAEKQAADNEKQPIKRLSEIKAFFIPVWCAAAFAYTWSGIGMVFTLYNSPGIFYTDAAILWFSVVMAAALFPLLYPLKDESVLRSAGVLFFLNAAWFSFTSLYTGMDYQTAGMLMAYLLWILANFALPALNRRWPSWKIGPVIWLWAGLMLITVTPFLTAKPEDVLLRWSYWLSASVYFFLLLRNTKTKPLSWAATGTFTWSGILLVGKYAQLYAYDIDQFIIGILIWANLLLFIAPLCQRISCRLQVAGRKSQVATDSKQQTTDNFQFSILNSQFSCWSFMISAVCLILLILADWMTFLNDGPPISRVSFMLIAGMVLISFSHLFARKPSFLTANSLILSVFALMLTGMAALSLSLSHLSLMLVLWSGGLFLFENWKPEIGTRKPEYFGVIQKSVSVWLSLSPWTVIPALLFIPVGSLKETLLTLGLLTGIFAGIAGRRESAGMLWIARLLFLILLHTWPLMWIPSNKTQGLVLWHIWPLLQAQYQRLQILFPWYSLQLGLIIWGLTWLRIRLKKRVIEKSFLRESLFRNLSPEVCLALSEIGLHFMVFMGQLQTQTIPGYAHIQGAAAIIAALLLMGLGIRRGYQSQEPGWLYGAAILCGAAAIYLRLLFVGLTPLTQWDTTAVMGAAFALLFIQRFTSSEIASGVLLRLVMILPVFSVITAPLQTGSLHTSSALLAAGALYISLRYTTGSSVALYLGTLAMNGAIYLWIPAWAERYDLIQLYAVPSALSVLILLHLHRNELRRGVLNGMRLAAVSTLYACATLDFFLSPELSNFVLVLLLSLAGTAAGVGLRVRAFLYGGTIFMVLNVLGQLFLFYSRQTMGKGIVLMAIGTLILAGMIWFNIKREDILKRVRIFRADLYQWE